MTKAKRYIVVCASLLLAIALLFGAGLLLTNGLSASAAENEPAIEADAVGSGWYTMGNGAGSLRRCSWKEYLPAFRLVGLSEDDPAAPYQNYLGTWTSMELLMYEGDQLKFLYNNGNWATPNASGWTNDVVASYSNLEQAGPFQRGSFDMIQVKIGESGYYTFRLEVSMSEGKVKKAIYCTKTDKTVPDITTMDMYVVGKIASVPDCGWPNEVDDVASSCIPMSYNTYEHKWVATVDLISTDQFKVYNLVDGTYYPGGLGDNYKRYEGKYNIEWTPGENSLIMIPASGWYVVGRGIGSLKQCSWDEYVPQFRLDGTPFSGSTTEDNYFGIWHTESLLLYKGDQFRFLYQDGFLTDTSESTWNYDVSIGFDGIEANNTNGAFTTIGLNDIEVMTSGYYTFYVYLARTAQGFTRNVTFVCDSTDVPERTLLNMYVVGQIESVPSCGWPGDYSTNVARDCIKMTQTSAGIWRTPKIYLTFGDHIKVYNLASDIYYPNGIGVGTVTSTGWFYVQWREYYNDFSLIAATA